MIALISAQVGSGVQGGNMCIPRIVFQCLFAVCLAYGVLLFAFGMARLRNLPPVGCCGGSAQDDVPPGWVVVAGQAQRVVAGIAGEGWDAREVWVDDVVHVVVLISCFDEENYEESVKTRRDFPNIGKFYLMRGRKDDLDVVLA